MYLKVSSFLVVGIKKSGYHATKLLLKNGATVYIYDKNVSSITKNNIEELSNLGAKFISNPFDVLDEIDVLVLSPGVPIDNELPITAKSKGVRVIGELELASYFIKNAPIVAVTGTNGKTTVCSMISHILTSVNEDNLLVGNIGTPLSSVVEDVKNNTICVTEVSSYQLETAYRFTPHIACILNITPDHLERHYNMDNYVYLKSKLLLNLKESEFAVLNYDDDIVKDLASVTKGKVLYFSLNSKVNGAYFENDNLMFNDEVVATLDDLKVKGNHNTLNALAVICILKLLGLNNEEIRSGLSSFIGVKHRIQPIREVNGVTFYNDSKSTNEDSTIKAIKSMKTNTVLILGGYDKGLTYTNLVNEIETNSLITSVILTGNSSKKMYEAFNEINNVFVIPDFTLAIKLSLSLSSNGYSVLFSPATSSFDKFNDFEERGDKFIEIVNSL